MKKLSAVLIAAVIALSAAGCSSAGNGSVSSDEAAAPSAAPITMAPDDPATEAPAVPEASDADFIAAIGPTWRGTSPSDSEFLAARDLACQMLEQGTPYDQVRVVEGEGEDADWNNDHLVQYAVQLQCPQFETD